MKTAKTNRRAARAFNAIVHKSDNAPAIQRRPRNVVAGAEGELELDATAEPDRAGDILRPATPIREPREVRLRARARIHLASIVMKTRICRHSSMPFHPFRGRETRLVSSTFSKCTAWSLPVHRVRVNFSIPISTSRVDRLRSFSFYLSRYENDSKLIRARICNRRVHTAQTIHSTVHTYTIIVDQCSCAPVIMCVHTNPCTYVLFTDR